MCLGVGGVPAVLATLYLHHKLSISSVFVITADITVDYPLHYKYLHIYIFFFPFLIQKNRKEFYNARGKREEVEGE